MADGLSSLGIFKHLPCPAGDKCTAFRCLFRHKSDEEAWPLPPQQVSPGDPSVVTGTHSSAPDAASNVEGSPNGPPQKRRKTSSDEAATRKDDGSVVISDGQEPLLATASATSLPLSVADKPYDPASPVIAGASSMTRSISPPSLKRKEPAGRRPVSEAKAPSTRNESPALKPPHATTASPQTPSKLGPSASKTPTPAQTPALKAARKPETLNPRKLASPPADHTYRLKLLKLLHGEYARLNNELKKDPDANSKGLVLSDQQLIWLALDEEQRIATESKAVYSNVIKNFIMRYKRADAAKWKSEQLEKKRKTELPKAKPEDKLPIVVTTGLTPAQEVRVLSRLITPITELSKFNYVSAVPTDEDIEQARKAEEMSKGWEQCDRCQKRFQVFPGRRLEDGKLASGGSCTFHWGKQYFPESQPGDKAAGREKRYRCCGQAVGDAAGCTTNEYHVWKTTDPKRLASVLPFAETPENPLAPADRAVAFDCEMCYTVRGLELLRLTATAWPAGDELLDVLVQPLGEVLDLNSRFSGVWPEDLEGASQWSAKAPAPPSSSPPEQQPEQPQPGARKRMQMVSSPEVARALLFSLIGPATPLIGHGLENDLNAARVVHPRVVDTVLLYPHRRGLPARHGLRMLMETRLNRRIQAETTGADGRALGHDSAEDARAAGELVRLRVREEWERMRREGWKLVGGEMVAP